MDETAVTWTNKRHSGEPQNQEFDLLDSSFTLLLSFIYMLEVKKNPRFFLTDGNLWSVSVKFSGQILKSDKAIKGLKGGKVV